MERNLYALQGIIFQQGKIFGTAYDQSIGIVATIKDAMIFAMFHGIVGSSKDNEKGFCGSMNDKWGESKITNFRLSDSELSFTKQYLIKGMPYTGRPVIEYVFDKKEGGIWFGTYSGQDCGEGKSKCVVTKIKESFFDVH